MKTPTIKTVVKKQPPYYVEHLANPLPTVITLAVLFGILLLQKWLHL